MTKRVLPIAAVLLGITAVTFIVYRGSAAEQPAYLKLDPPAEWEVSPSPTLTIGSMEGEDGHDLHRVSGAVLLSDSVLLIANRGATDVRIFGFDGSLRSKNGEQGSGPKSFEYVGRAVPLTGSEAKAAVITGRLRYATFDANGVQLEQVFVESDYPHRDSRPQQATPLPNGGLLLQENFDRPDRGEFRVKTHYVVVNPDDSIIHPFGWIQGLVHIDNGEETLVQGFSPDTYIAVGTNGIYVADSYEGIIRRYDLNGALDREIDLELKPQPATRAERRAYKKKLLAFGEKVPDERRADWNRRAKMIPYAKTIPLFNDMVVDDTGNIWLREYDVGQNPEWFVIGPTGEAIARVTAPGLDRVLQIADDKIVAMTSDEFGVQQVSVYRLTK